MFYFSCFFLRNFYMKRIILNILLPLSFLFGMNVIFCGGEPVNIEQSTNTTHFNLLGVLPKDLAFLLGSFCHPQTVEFVSLLNKSHHALFGSNIQKKILKNKDFVLLIKQLFLANLCDPTNTNK